MTSRARGSGTSEFAQVRRTGDWSLGSKLCSIENGWWHDPFFRKFNYDEPIPKRTSLICFGYYVRFRVCDYFVRQLISEFTEPLQIVSLGSGMDTLYFRLLTDNNQGISRFYDIDYPSVILRKQQIIQNDTTLLQTSSKLYLIGADLRFMNDNVSKQLAAAGFDFTAPTLFYSECVVNYLEYSESDDIVRWICQNVPRAIFMAYEQANPNDSFGQIMTEHFQKNGCPIRSVHKNATLDDQRFQLKRHGFSHAYVVNAWDAFNHIFKNETLNQIPTGDSYQFDEFESLIATCLHYSVRIGITEQMGMIAQPVFSNLFYSHQEKPSAHILQVDNVRTLTCISGLKIRGHSSVVIDNKVYVLGGQNQGSIFQPCLTCLTFSISKDGAQVTTQLLARNDLFARSYAGIVYDTVTDSILVFGGRKAPKNPITSDIMRISNVSSFVGTASSDCLKSEQEPLTENSPFPLWRFTATTYTDTARNHDVNVFLCSGKRSCGTEGIPTQQYLWIRALDKTKESGWVTLNNDFLEDIPSARHSHATCACPSRNSIFVVGGISVNDTLLCDDALWEYQLDNGKQWNRLQQFESIGRKVGHKVLFHGSVLHIIGGYGNDSDCNLETFITTLDLDTKQIQHYELKMEPPQLFLSFDFSAHVLQPEGTTDDYLVVFGGGGNCFSFGSHYNTDCFLFKLPLMAE